jgi:hypothetical protein
LGFRHIGKNTLFIFSLIISVPGNACGIFPEDNYNWKVGEGRKFSSHNMDDPGQQIMILVALAILSDMAREYMKG